jgi:hypothetical protein
MSFVTRAINVLTQPKAELYRAAAEPATTGGLIGGYAALLAALPALGRLLSDIIESGSYLSTYIGKILGLSLLLYIVRDLGLAVLMGFIAAALAPNFGGFNNQLGAMKLALYAATPIWLTSFIGGLLSFAVPELGAILVVIGFGYAGYLLYVGCRPLLGVPDAQAPAVAGILTIIWLVLYFVVAAIFVRIFWGSGYSLI